MTVYTECPKRKELDINVTAQDLLKEITVPLGAEAHPLFKKYGVSVNEIGTQWFWFEKEIPDEDAWQMIALANTYWFYFYQYIYEKKSYEEYKEQVKKWAEKNPEFNVTLLRLVESEKELEKVYKEREKK